MLDFRVLFESVPGAYLVTDKDFKIVAVSNAYLNATMTKREQILRRNIFDVFPDNPEDPTANGVHNLRKSLETVLKTGMSDTMAIQKYDIRRPESVGGGFEERYWSPVNSPVFGANHKVAYIIHRVEDVTEFVRLKQQGNEQRQENQALRNCAEHLEAEIYQRGQELQDLNRQLRKVNEELAKQHALFEAVLRQMPAGVMIADALSKLILSNEQVKQILGCADKQSSPLDEYSWMKQFQAFHLDGQPYTTQDCPFIRSLQTGEIIKNEEIELHCQDGSHVFISANSAPIRDSAEQIVAAVMVVEDATARKQAEQEREQLFQREQAARREAETANRIKDEFLAVLSHEIRSPLNPILGWSQLLQNKKLDEDRRVQALKVIQRNAQLQAELIEDLLDISRILRGKLSLNIVPVDLATTIQAAMETVHLAAQAKSIQIQTKLSTNIGQVSGDANRLQQVIWNLLSNAIKFTDVGGRVDIQLERLNSQAVITVSDAGKGIDPSFLPYMFDYFRQADSTTTRKFGGLGLGLAIARHLVELHDGIIQAQSPGINQGATFIVKLPLLPTQPLTTLDSEQSKESLDLNGIKILVVEDDADTRELTTFLLEQSGASVTAVASASEALIALTKSQPDVLLSDIGMPDIDGYMLMQQVRTLPPEQGGQIPAIALTAYAGEFDYQQALKVGFQRHIAKPVEANKLVTMITDLVGEQLK